MMETLASYTTLEDSWSKQVSALRCLKCASNLITDALNTFFKVFKE